MSNILKPLTFNLIFLFIQLLIVKLNGVINKHEELECPQSAFIGCIIQLKLNGVIFDRNIANIIYSIDSETKLLKTCKAYTNTLPCFREKILQCGSQKQRRMLNSVGKSIDFLCSPFSLGNQRVLISKGSCINHVINKPIANKCEIDEPRLYSTLISCAKSCEHQKGNIFCHMRTWISTQNLCTTLEIYKNCGSDAASFYSDFQSVAFEPTFPIVCHASIESIANVKNFFKYNSGKHLYEKKFNKVEPFVNKNTNIISNIVKEKLLFTDFNDQNTNDGFINTLNAKKQKNSDNLKRTEKILEKVFPDMITKNYANLLTTTTFKPIVYEKQKSTYSYNDITTPKPYHKFYQGEENNKVLTTATYNDERRINNFKKGTVLSNEIELLAKIISSLPVNNTPKIHKSFNSNDVLSIKPQSTTINYNNNEKDLLNFFSNQNDNDQIILSPRIVEENIENKENVTSTEDNLEDYEYSIEYQTSSLTTTTTTRTTPIISKKVNIPRKDIIKKSEDTQNADGKKVPWYLRSMKKHVFINTNSELRKFSQ
uniref:ShKT domain-containing protein n=1 Tax=Strongyloides venezuelensis TaxID=75913 RepID=A0A0K0G4X1_STRVS